MVVTKVDVFEQVIRSRWKIIAIATLTNITINAIQHQTDLENGVKKPLPTRSISVVVKKKNRDLK